MPTMSSAQSMSRFQAGLARQLLWRVPLRWRLRLAGQQPFQLDGLTLDPDLQLALAVRERSHPPVMGKVPLEMLRARTHADGVMAAGPPIPVGQVSSLTVAGAEGPLAARHYAPSPGAGPRPLLLFFHGGGFVFGDLDTHDGMCRLLCRYANLHVVSVAYRLAPEHPFPAAVEDAWAAWQWAASSATWLGADPSRIAVGGDSAGAHLSAIVSQLAAASEGAVPPPALQMLLYPPIDRLGVYASLELFAEGLFLTKAEIDFFEQQYVGLIDDDPSDARRHPLAAKDLSGLAPALVVTGGFDPLRDEGEAYAAAMAEAGTPVVLRRFPNLIHAFANMIGVSQAARAAMIEVAHRVAVMLTPPPRP
jgi:acetyl esterase